MLTALHHLGGRSSRLHEFRQRTDLMPVPLSPLRQGDKLRRSVRDGDQNGDFGSSRDAAFSFVMTTTGVIVSFSTFWPASSAAMRSKPIPAMTLGEFWPLQQTNSGCS